MDRATIASTDPIFCGCCFFSRDQKADCSTSGAKEGDSVQQSHSLACGQGKLSVECSGTPALCRKGHNGRSPLLDCHIIGIGCIINRCIYVQKCRRIVGSHCNAAVKRLTNTHKFNAYFGLNCRSTHKTQEPPPQNSFGFRGFFLSVPESVPWEANPRAIAGKPENAFDIWGFSPVF